MLIPFYLDEHFFDSVYFYDEDYDSAHDNFLKFWDMYGVLIYSESQNIDFYRKLIKKFPNNFQQRWNEALFGFSKFEVNKVSFEKFKDCKINYEELLNQREFYNFGLTDKDSLKIVKSLKDFQDFQDFQVRCLENYTSSEIYNNTIMYASSLISENEQIDEVWDVKFKNLAKYTKNIIILDRYLFANIIEDMESRETSIKKFFNFLSKCVVSEINFTFISDGGDKESEFHSNIRGYLSSQIVSVSVFRRIIKSLKIYSVQNSFFQKNSHDRFLICDKHYCHIGAGFQLFRNFPVSSTVCGLSLLRESQIRTIVQKAQRNAEWKEDIL